MSTVKYDIKVKHRKDQNWMDVGHGHPRLAFRNVFKNAKEKNFFEIFDEGVKIAAKQGKSEQELIDIIKKDFNEIRKEARELDAKIKKL